MAACTASTANAVYVVFGLHGQAIVEHVGDGGHVNAAGRHIGGHQNLYLACTQRHEAAVTQALAQCTVQSYSGKAHLLQIFGQGVAFNLGAGKHNGLVNRGIAQPMVEQLALVVRAVAPKELLLNVAVAVLGRINLDLLRVAHHTGGQRLNAGCKRGTEHHGLLTRNRQLVDFSQVVSKTEVEHAVGFVHHQKLHFTQLELTTALQIQQTAWRGHHQVGILQLGNLHLVRHATHHSGNAQTPAMLDQTNGVVRHLLSQFACGAQHQRTRHDRLKVAGQQRVLTLWALGLWLAFGSGLLHLTVPFGLFLGLFGVLLLQQRVQHRQQECSGFATTGLARDHQVGVGLTLAHSLHGFGNAGLLHQGRFGIAQVGHGLNQFGRKAQIYKKVFRLRHVIRPCAHTQINLSDEAGMRPRSDLFVVTKHINHKQITNPLTQSAANGCWRIP